MRKRVIRTTPTLSETIKALKSVPTTNIRIDLQNQLRQAEAALKRKDMSAVINYMQGLVSTVLILRRTLSAAVAGRILLGITIDCHNCEIVLPLVNYTKNSRCVFNTGACTRKTGSWCVKYDTVWGCGTVPHGPWLASQS